MASVQLKLGPADHGHPLTLDDFDAADFEPGFRYEIIDGRLYVSTLPNPAENVLEMWLFLKLYMYSAQQPGVLNYVTTKARVFARSGASPAVPEPDVTAYQNFPKGHGLEQLRWEDVAPVLVVEVLVDGEPAKDLDRNVELYLSVPSIKEYWVLDGRENPEEPTLIQHRRYGKRWVVRAYPFGSTLTTKLLPGFSLLIDPYK